MNTKRTILSILLVFAILVSPVLPWTPATVLADTSRTLMISNKTLYTELKKSMKMGDNSGALLASNDETQELTVDMDKVTLIYMLLNGKTNDDFRNNFTALLEGCTNLKSIRLRNADLSGIDFSTIKNREKITSLYLVKCKLEAVPDLDWKNLTTLCLSQNNLSADGACDAITKDNFPQLTTLWLDECQLSDTDINFCGELENLTNLSLAENRLTNDSITALTNMEKLSGLEYLWLGEMVHIVVSGTYTYMQYGSSSNRLTDLTGLASLPDHFSQLKKLDLTGLRIESLQAFTNITNKDIEIDFRLNKITDFAGLESNPKFKIEFQNISLPGKLAPGEEKELPELFKRILDSNDMLNVYRLPVIG